MVERKNHGPPRAVCARDPILVGLAHQFLDQLTRLDEKTRPRFPKWWPSPRQKSSRVAKSITRHYPRDANRRFRPADACRRRSSRFSADSLLAIIASAPLRELAWIRRRLSGLFPTVTPSAFHSHATMVETPHQALMACADSLRTARIRSPSRRIVAGPCRPGSTGRHLGHEIGASVNPVTWTRQSRWWHGARSPTRRRGGR